jgi:hypothetical protein
MRPGGAEAAFTSCFHEAPDMRKGWRTAALTLIPLGITRLCTGGCVVHRYWLLLFDSYDRAFCPYLKPV